MKSQMICVVASAPAPAEEWRRIVAATGASPISVALGERPAPTTTTQACEVGAWVVVLDTRQTPMKQGFWLRTLSAPIILVTPHLIAAQALASLVPDLRVICPPLRAAAHMSDLLAVALASTGGTLVVPNELIERPRLALAGGYT